MPEPHSGQFGVVNGESSVRNWSVTETAEDKVFRASNTQGGTGRRTGVRDWSGNFGQYGAIPVTMPGSTFTFEGFTAPDDDVQGNAGQRYSGPAIVDSVVITWMWGDNSILSSQTNFSGNGVLANNNGVYSDATNPDVPPTCGTKIEYNAAVEWTNVTQAVLTISSLNQPYVNSSTIVGGECWRMRKAGPKDFTLAITEQNATRLPALTPGEDLELKLYTDASLFWHLKWARLGNFSGIVVNPESGVIIQRVANLAMNGYNPGVGFIRKPNAVPVDWWPAT